RQAQGGQVDASLEKLPGGEGVGGGGGGGGVGRERPAPRGGGGGVYERGGVGGVRRQEVEGTLGAARPDPFGGADRSGGASEVGHNEDVAHRVGAGKSPVGVLADRVLEEPKAERGAAGVVEAVGAEIDDRVVHSADRHTVSGGEGVGDVRLVLR